MEETGIQKGCLTRKRIPFILILFLILLIAGGSVLIIWYKPAPFQVALTGDSVSMGSGYGKKLRFPINLVNRYYIEKVVCQGNPAQIESGRTAALRNLGNWPVQYQEELKAAAEATHLSLGSLAFGNSFLDLGKVRSRCRSAVLCKGDTVLHAHNLDWDNLSGLGRWSVCITRRKPTDGRFATVSVGFPGQIGAMDTINEHGLAISFNQLGWGRGGTNEPVFIMIRRIAEHCNSLDSARGMLLQAPPGMPFLITVSDARVGTGSVFERVHERITERPLHMDFVSACNAAQGTNFGTTKLDQILAAAKNRTVSGVQEIMGSSGVLLECNIYSVVFDYHADRMYLASGVVPAARGRYREYPLFR